MKQRSRFDVTSISRSSSSARVLATALIVLCFLCVYTGMAAAALRLQNPDVPGDAEQALFIKGQNLYGQGLYHEAIAVFEDFLKAYPKSEIKDLALLWLGRCHLRVADVPGAEQIAIRLREIPDTQFVRLFEEELRVERQSYVKGATPKERLESPSATARSSIKAPRDSKPAPSGTRLTSAQSKSNSGASIQALPNEFTRAKPAITANRPSPIEQSKAMAARHAPAKATTTLEPLVRIRMVQSPLETTVGGAIFYRLVIVNEGKAIAKDLVVGELLDNDSQFASSDPAPSRQEPVGRSQRLVFRIAELKPGASRTLRIAIRPRGDAAAATVLQAKHFVTYRDSSHKSYKTD